VRVVDVVRVEPEAPAVEVEARGAAEIAVGIGSELITCGIDPEPIEVLETVLVREQNEPDLVRAQADLVSAHHGERTTDGTATVADTELSRDDENVVAGLLDGDLLHRLDLLVTLAEVARTELTVAGVLEAPVAGLLQLRENDLDGFAVGRGHFLPRQDEEVALRPHRCILGRERHVVGFGLREDALDRRELVCRRVRLLVAREVAVLRLDLLVGELVHEGEAAQEGEDVGHDADHAELDEALHGVLVERELVERLVGGVGDETDRVLDLTFGSGYGR